MMLTKRDAEILQFVNEFGFCEAGHIANRFGIKLAWCYQVLKRLVSSGYLVHKKIFYRYPGIFYVTPTGAQLTDLPALKQIPIAKYEHELAIVNVFLKLRSDYPSMQWISERRIMQQKYALNKRNHIADALMILGEKQVAIEVELTLKSKNRLENILKNYAAEFSISEVWYFCKPFLISTMRELVSNLPMIKVHNIEEFLHG